MIFQQTCITIAQVDCPGTDNTRVCPCWSAVGQSADARQRRNWRVCAFGALCILQVADPFGKERRNVRVEGSRADEYLRIARPSQTLIALRAIGWDIKKIALLPPDDIALQLVDQRVGTIELAVGGVAEWMTIPETASMSGTPGYPESSTYRKP